MTATLHAAPAPAAPGHSPGGLAARLWRGRPEDPRWARPALLGLLALTAVMYLWNLSASGWANSFYAAAVQAGTESWKAFFFGSSDAANSITVDKTPASLWAMEISCRIFGMNSWAMLAPQALMGVATTGVLYAAVRRRFNAAAGLITGAVFALTPVAALMFRFNNPDAMLVLLMVLACYAVLRAVEDGRTRWLVLAGALVGFAFLAKMLQAFLVLPALGLVYLVCAPVGVWRRIGQVAIGLVSMVVAAGWWIAIVEFWPAGSRPYIGGSQDNSILELTLGYNGLGRLNGEETGSVGGGGGPGGGGGGMWGETGIGRLFGDEMGGYISWLMPAAFILLVAGLVVTRRRPRTSATRAGLVMWGTWLLTHWLVFSYMQGIFHQYYNVAVAPGIAAVVGMGAVLLWQERRHPAAAATLAAATAVTAWWAYTLLDRTPDWHPWLRYAVLAGGVAGALALLAAGRLAARVGLVVAGVALVSALAGPAAYALQTASTPHQGSIPTAGPAGQGGFGPGGGRGGPGGRFPGGRQGGNQQGTAQQGGQNQAQGGQLPGGGQAPGGQGGQQGGPGGLPGGGFPGGQQGNGQQGNGQQGNGQNGQAPSFPGGQEGGAGGAGGLLNGSDPSDEVVALLEKDSDQYTWVAAAIGSQNASGYQLSTGDPVMPVGGFNGTDPSPTLARFKKLVEQGRIHYFVGGGMGGGRGGAATGQETAANGTAANGTAGGGFGGGTGGDADSPSSQISSWVQENFTATTVDGVTLYDLTDPA